MIQLLKNNRHGPIGVDFGGRSVKLLQLDASRTHVMEKARWELPISMRDEALQGDGVRQAAAEINRLRRGGGFRGNEVVACVGADMLHVQNIRIPKSSHDDINRFILQEMSGRLPFTMDQAAVRYIETTDVRQGDAVKREVIVLACHQPTLDAFLDALVEEGLRPVAVDAAPLAMLRCYARQFRREEDRMQRVMFIHIGASGTTVVIAEGKQALFVKNIDFGGDSLDHAIATHLGMAPPEAAALRRQFAARSEEDSDAELARGLADSLRGATERLAKEIEMCSRYHSVTFRGKPLSAIVIGGNQASDDLAQAISTKLELPCEIGRPFRALSDSLDDRHDCQWDIAVGLALREVNSQ